MSALMAAPPASYERRRRRAGELAERWPHAAAVLGLYSALLDVQEPAAEAARAAGPGFAELPAWIAGNVVPQVAGATAAAGPEPLVAAVQALVYSGDPAAAVGAWLCGAELAPAARYLARAASTPVLEALPGVLPAPAGSDGLRCPECGAPPQLSVFSSGGEALVTGQRLLECSRCARSWPYPRMVCAGCGESETQRLPVLADHDVFPHLRLDACETCSTYLVTVDANKDGRAVPAVDELVAVPLDLVARERGLRKVTTNLMGF